MSAVDQLITYILSLTPEQVEKAVSCLPQVSEELAKLQQPALQSGRAQNE